ncbi:MAG: archease [Methanomassiliicoccales archaeon]|nr:archease [Methanomassiliicoccales archaeon]
MRYEQLEHTADVMIKAHGSTLEECFENAAYALTDQMVDASLVRPEIEMTFQVNGEDPESLLYNFLSEFLYIRDVKHLIFSTFKVKIEGNSLFCSAKGETLEACRHKARHDVKAVTYHMLQVDQMEPSVRVIFDI